MKNTLKVLGLVGLLTLASGCGSDSGKIIYSGKINTSPYEYVTLKGSGLIRPGEYTLEVNRKGESFAFFITEENKLHSFSHSKNGIEEKFDIYHNCREVSIAQSFVKNYLDKIDNELKRAQDKNLERIRLELEGGKE